MIRKLVALAIAMVALAVTGRAHADITCPQTVSTESKAIAPDGWSLDYTKAPAELSSVTIFDGAPEELASLKYDDEHTTKSELIQTWQLPTSERGYWIVCGYSNTMAQLRHKLPNDIAKCEVVFEKGVSFAGGGMVVKRARCMPAGTSHKAAH